MDGQLLDRRSDSGLNGNHDGSGLTSSSNNVTRVVVNSYMENVHKNLYAQEGKWKSGDEPVATGGNSGIDRQW